MPPPKVAIARDPMRGRGVTAVLGPTNTGKTHLAIERMLAHEVGIIGLPLRLLAREVYDKVAAKVGAEQVALITGEEKIKPASARFYVCTVEAMPLELEADFLAIDEIQLAADGERGHVFTDRLFHARGLNETLVLGAATMRDAIRELLPAANIVSRPRLSTLNYAGDKKITRLPRRSAIVAFSANDVYAIAELVRRQRGGAAVVLGALSPRTRNAQVALYQNGDVDFLVATDAIGMGLNLDLDHVAFAGMRKFDGHSHRNLTPAELGQIAGRAGRYMNDGTFGVTGQMEPFPPELIDRLENHSFDPVGMLQWRNRKLDVASIESLKESLRITPDHPRLMRSRMVDDVIALENVSQDALVRELATHRAAVALLWNMCQVPDYRKISPVSHAEIVSTLFRFVVEDGKIPDEWFARQVALSDRSDGDIDTLSSRLAQIRTWTFVSHRAEWLDDPEGWQARTRAIEDTLSDALHERLTMRFVDRRTSVLMRRLRDREELIADIDAEGRIVVEDHYVGRLDGFRFTPDSHGDGIHSRAARHAATSVLSRELSRRTDAFAAASDKDIELGPDARIRWSGSEVGKLERGDGPLSPRIVVIADDQLPPPDRERVQRRLDDWLSALLRQRLGPLLGLREASDLTGLARGLAFRLVESLGVLRRDGVAAELAALDQSERAKLRKYGVRFGAFNIYVPALLKPAAAQLLLSLWALHSAEGRGADPAGLPERPQQGLTSVPADNRLPEAYWHAAGFQRFGTRAVRIDMLERLADLIRERIAWRAPKEEAQRADDTETAAPAPAAPAAPSGATGDGGFRVSPELMSVVGCSGEEFASILRAFGFRSERKTQPPVAGSGDAQPSASPGEDIAAADQAANDVAAAPPGEPEFVEIWRPRRRKVEQRAKAPSARTRSAESPRAQARPNFKARKRTEPRSSGVPVRTPSERTQSERAPSKRKGPPKDSPFAVLAELKRNLELRNPEKR